MKQYKDKTMSTRLMSTPEGTSYKLIIKFGDNIREKIFDGKNAYKRATLFQNNVSDLMNTVHKFM